ncbi:MAG TPA: hypothetical protein VFY36_08045 [Solirubrobacteraceae bacterium]|nr:hypothetical protein [Solirubrobacteraceae bacterium]
MTTLPEKLLAIHDALSAADLPHAFGGAIALAYCTEEPRGTRDIDVNVFAEPGRAAEILAAFPTGSVVSPTDIKTAERDGQVRVWWEDTPIDLFLDVHAFHAEVAAGVRTVPFSGRSIPVVGCTALVVFKTLLDRTKDWADIEAVTDAGAADLKEALVWVERALGADDQSVQRLTTLTQQR